MVMLVFYLVISKQAYGGHFTQVQFRMFKFIFRILCQSCFIDNPPSLYPLGDCNAKKNFQIYTNYYIYCKNCLKNN